MVLVQRACKESRTPAAVRLFGQKEKIYRMAFGQYVSLLNAKGGRWTDRDCSTREVTIEIPILGALRIATI